MGLFDTVMATLECPICHRVGEVDVQTKAFDPMLATFRIGDNVTSAYRGDYWVDGIWDCSDCRRRFEEALEEARRELRARFRVPDDVEHESFSADADGTPYLPQSRIRARHEAEDWRAKAAALEQLTAAFQAYRASLDLADPPDWQRTSDLFPTFAPQSWDDVWARTIEDGELLLFEGGATRGDPKQCRRTAEKLRRFGGYADWRAILEWMHGEERAIRDAAIAADRGDRLDLDVAEAYRKLEAPMPEDRWASFGFHDAEIRVQDRVIREVRTLDRAAR